MAWVSPSAATAEAMSQRVSPSPTITRVVGSGWPPCSVATDAPPNRMKAVASTTRSEAMKTTRRPRRVRRTLGRPDTLGRAEKAWGLIVMLLIADLRGSGLGRWNLLSRHVYRRAPTVCVDQAFDHTFDRTHV
ncbi:hypothetical protein NOCA2790001 [metagenome]|uniref:Uncharacterized protein n=1 Tax=metagenome TaxID=256318 RepID=A0A2P2CEN1_9ZZZZ